MLAQWGRLDILAEVMTSLSAPAAALSLALLLVGHAACKTRESSQGGKTTEPGATDSSNADRAIDALDGVAKEICVCRDAACIEAIETRLKKSPPPMLKELAGGGAKGSRLTEAQQAQVHAIGTAAQECIDTIRQPAAAPAEAAAPTPTAE